MSKRDPTQNPNFILADFTYGSSHVPTYLALYATILKQGQLEPIIICHPTSVPKVEELLAEHHCQAKMIPSVPRLGKRILFSVLRRTETRFNLSFSGFAKRLGESTLHPLTNWLILFSQTKQSRNARVTSIFFPLGNGMICRDTSLWRQLAPPSWSIMLLGTSWMRKQAKENPGILKNTCLNHISCKAVFTLSQEDAINLKEMGVTTKITCLPDITSVILNPPSERVKILLDKTQNTKRIVLTGMLDRRKGILDLLQAAELLPNDYSVILAGEFPSHSYTDQELSSIELLLKNPRVHFSPGWIENESDLNNLIQASDAVYLAYQNFEGSSNVLTKSAHFYRPVLVTDTTEMARRVSEFNIGITTSSYSAHHLAELIKTTASLTPPKTNFERFVEKYGSHESVYHALTATTNFTN
jgi:glycosyltransferase involved in cell wall biosynthesis